MGNKPITTVGTHDGVFHADEVFAIAALQLLHPELRVVRSRDTNVLKDCDVLVDVGAVYSPREGKFDHHQKDRAGARANGVLYSSFGLVWQEYAAEICRMFMHSEHQVAELAVRIDNLLVQAIDATDNGQSLHTAGSQTFEGVRSLGISAVIGLFNPTWNEPKDFDEKFHVALGVARELLLRVLRQERGQMLAVEKTLHDMQHAEDRQIIVLSEFRPWVETITSKSGDALYCVFPSETGTYMVQSVPATLGGFDLRKPLPEAWAGLRDEELCDATGVADAIFCHPGRFICGAKTLKGALTLARLAVVAT